MWDKINDVEQVGSGQLVSKYVLSKSQGKGAAPKPYTFSSKKDFEAWKGANRKRYLTSLRKRLSPHQFYLT